MFARQLVRAACAATVAATLLAAVPACTTLDEAELAERAASLHREVATIDAHVDIPNRLGFGDADPVRPGPMQYDLPKMAAGGIDGAFFIVYTRQGELTNPGYMKAFLTAMQKLDAIERMTYRSGGRMALARSPEDFEANLAAGRLSAMIGVENGYPLGADLQHLPVFISRGASYISLTHDGNNQLGTSARPREHETGEDTGLTATGRKLIEQLNGYGVMIDVSHASDNTTLQAAALSRAPLLASHSSAAAVFDHPRNLSDAEIRAIAATGGVVQVVAFDSYLRAITDDNRAASLALMEAAGFDGPDWYNRSSQTDIAALREQVNALDATWPRATVATLVDHIDHVVDLVGIDHVGIASDFGGGGGVAGWDDASESVAVTRELLRRGYSAQDIGKIWGGNLLRAWREVRRLAR